MIRGIIEALNTLEKRGQKIARQLDPSVIALLDHFTDEDDLYDYIQE